MRRRGVVLPQAASLPSVCVCVQRVSDAYRVCVAAFVMFVCRSQREQSASMRMRRMVYY